MNVSVYIDQIAGVYSAVGSDKHRSMRQQILFLYHDRPLRYILKACIIVHIRLVMIMVTGLFTEIRVEAKISQPVIKLKKTNDGTGVKIIIEKTSGAKGYIVYMMKRKDAYRSYLFNNGEGWTELAVIRKNGKQEREFVINGLPEGKYTFMVEACKFDSHGEPESNGSRTSEQKSVKIKVAKSIETPATPVKTCDFLKAEKGDIVEFGAYEQDDLMNSGKEPIEWIVLEKNEDTILLLSKYALDVLPFHKDPKGAYWESSSLRKWLNGYFLNNAFSDAEKEMIAETELTNAANIFYPSEAIRKNTRDKVFLLTLEDMADASYGFATEGGQKADKTDIKAYNAKEINRICAATPYAKALGLRTSGEEAACTWWLRTPGYLSTNATDVTRDGVASVGGSNVYMTGGVRPAIYIKLR